MNPRHPTVEKIEGIMAGDETGRHPFLEQCLQTAAVGYGGAVRARGALYRRGILRPRRLSCAVISVGNLTLGGTGKTPLTLYLSRLLTERRRRVVILSRGYRGRAEKSGGVVSDGRRLLLGPEEAGDEPFMMACRLRNVPVVVGRSRHAAGLLAQHRFSPEVVILDDGFQHRRLHRDLDLVLLDRGRPLGNRRMFPRGTLREPVSALERADACVLTRGVPGAPAGPEALPFLPPGMPVFAAGHRTRCYRRVGAGHAPVAENGQGPLEAADPRNWRGRPVFAFSGIANNADFRQSVATLFGGPAGHLAFPDHYRYTGADLARIRERARAAGGNTLVTTEKDFARVGHRIDWQGDLVVIGIDTCFGDDEERFVHFVEHRLASAGEGGRT